MIVATDKVSISTADFMPVKHGKAKMRENLWCNSQTGKKSFVSSHFVFAIS